MQQDKMPGESECDWLLRKMKENREAAKSATGCELDGWNSEYKDLSDQWTARCRGWRGGFLPWEIFVA